jgi:hypothetical protein
MSPCKRPRVRFSSTEEHASLTRLAYLESTSVIPLANTFNGLKASPLLMEMVSQFTTTPSEADSLVLLAARCYLAGKLSAGVSL